MARSAPAPSVHSERARPPARAPAPQVRVGQPAKVRPELRHACLDARVEATRAGQQAARMRGEADRLLSQMREGQRQLAAAEAELKQQQRQRGQQAQQGAAQRGQQLGAAQQQLVQRRLAAQLERQQQAARRSPAQAAAALAAQRAALAVEAERQRTAEQRAAALAGVPSRDQLRELKRRADALWARADEVVSQEALGILRAAPVVVATCNGAGEARLARQAFRIVVLDEASQVGLTRGGAGAAGGRGARGRGVSRHGLPRRCMRLAGQRGSACSWLPGGAEGVVTRTRPCHPAPHRPPSPPRWCRWSRAPSA